MTKKQKTKKSFEGLIEGASFGGSVQLGSGRNISIHYSDSIHSNMYSYVSTFNNLKLSWCLIDSSLHVLLLEHNTTLPPRYNQGALGTRPRVLDVPL